MPCTHQFLLRRRHPWGRQKKTILRNAAGLIDFEDRLKLLLPKFIPAAYQGLEPKSLYRRCVATPDLARAWSAARHSPFQPGNYQGWRTAGVRRVDRGGRTARAGGSSARISRRRKS